MLARIALALTLTLAAATGAAAQEPDLIFKKSTVRQVGPVKFKQKFGQGDVVFSERRSFIFKKMQIVRGCDVKRNTLVYMVYSDRPIEGSPKNSTSTVPLMPWGTEVPPKCGEWMNS
jgi:CreA protein